jgi:hypothetical protein
MFGFQHGKVAFAEGELSDSLFCHPSDLPPNDGLHTRFKCGHRFADLILGIVRQWGVLRLFFALLGEMVFPELADPLVIALAFKSFVNVCGGCLPAELCRLVFASFDDLFIGINRAARHVLLLLLPFAGGTWVRFQKRRNKLSNFFA